MNEDEAREREEDMERAREEAAYSAPLEDESLADAEPDEELARTQEALERQRAARDADLSFEEPVDLGMDDGHDDEREILGFDLAWWGEEKDIPPLDLVSEMANQVCGYTQHLRKLSDHGLPLDAMPAEIVLNHFSAPVVVAALQILGTLHSHLRDDVTVILKTLHDVMPVATEEEEEAMRSAHEALQRERFEEARKAFEAQGIPVMTPEEFAEEMRRKNDAGMN